MLCFFYYYFGRSVSKIGQNQKVGCCLLPKQRNTMCKSAILNLYVHILVTPKRIMTTLSVHGLKHRYQQTSKSSSLRVLITPV